MKKNTLAYLALLVSISSNASTLESDVQNKLAPLEQLYLDLHQSPELSYHEKETAKKN